MKRAVLVLVPTPDVYEQNALKDTLRYPERFSCSCFNVCEFVYCRHVSYLPSSCGVNKPSTADGAKSPICTSPSCFRRVHRFLRPLRDAPAGEVGAPAPGGGETKRDFGGAAKIHYERFSRRRCPAGLASAWRLAGKPANSGAFFLPRAASPFLRFCRKLAAVCCPRNAPRREDTALRVEAVSERVGEGLAIPR